MWRADPLHGRPSHDEGGCGGGGRSIVFAMLAIGIFLGAALTLGSFHVESPPGGGPSGLQPATVSINTHTFKTCNNQTACAAAGLSVAAYTSVMVLISADSTTAPSSVTSSPSETWTKEGKGYSSPLEDYNYEADNLSSTTLTVTVHYTASTTYAFDVVDLSEVTTVAFDAIGSVGTAIAATSMASVTTTQTEDIVFLNLVLDANESATANSGDTLLDQGAVGAFDMADFYEADSSSGAITLKATQTSVKYVANAIGLKSAAVPTAPTALTVGTVTTTSIALSWTRANGPDTDFDLDQASYAAGACGSYSNIYTGTAAADAATGLTTGHGYCFKVDQDNTTGATRSRRP